VSVAPCRGGLCRSPSISHNQHHTASPRHSHNQYMAPIRDGPLMSVFSSRLTGGAKTCRKMLNYLRCILAEATQSKVKHDCNTEVKIDVNNSADSATHLSGSYFPDPTSITRAPRSLAHSCEETKHVSNITLHTRMHWATTAYTPRHLPIDRR
jgi:hypothetical protein